MLSITAAGRAAMTAWACDEARAISVGIDPFRLRAGIWRGLPAARQRAVLAKLRQALHDDIAKLKTYVLHDDVVEKASLELAIKLQEARLEWLERVRAG